MKSPHSRALASRFYQELFAAAPHLRPLFPADMTSLQGHFEAALALVIRNLEDMSALQDSLRDLGAQHVRWGAKPEDYVTVRAAIVRATAIHRLRGTRRWRQTGIGPLPRSRCRCCKGRRYTRPSSPSRWRPSTRSGPEPGAQATICHTPFDTYVRHAPANIKVRSDGTVKVLDFGLAKAIDPVQPWYVNEQRPHPNDGRRQAIPDSGSGGEERRAAHRRCRQLVSLLTK